MLVCTHHHLRILVWAGQSGCGVLLMLFVPVRHADEAVRAVRAAEMHGDTRLPHRLCYGQRYPAEGVNPGRACDLGIR
ncbi:hypothetical protein GCM10010169_63810 [Micromonospora fulviviridis]|nr:hypothetical protein GCM10010169_63810 [Micromonospora fulviviridis]